MKNALFSGSNPETAYQNRAEVETAAPRRTPRLQGGGAFGRSLSLTLAGIVVGIALGRLLFPLLPDSIALVAFGVLSLAAFASDPRLA